MKRKKECSATYKKGTKTINIIYSKDFFTSTSSNETVLAVLQPQNSEEFPSLAYLLSIWNASLTGTLA